MKRQTVHCACGKVHLEAAGVPIVATVCHCDDCQEGSRQLEALPGAPPILQAAGGSPYILYRKDRVNVVSGGEFLTDHRLPAEASTKRVYATCCHSAMYLDFEPGHWFSLYRGRFEGPVTPVQMHMQTKYAPAGSTIPTDAPAFAGFPPRFIFKLLGARVAMIFSR